MANGKRGLRKGKKKESADTGERADAGQPTDRAAAMDPKDTSEATDAPCLACKHHKTQLGEANQKILDLEALQYQHEDSEKESKEVEKRAMRGFDAQINDLNGRIKQQEEEFEAEKRAKLAAKRDLEAQKSTLETLKGKFKTSEGHVADNLLELHRSETARMALNDQLRHANEELKTLRGHIYVFTDDHQKRVKQESAVAESVNAILAGENGREEDMTRREKAFQEQKEELEELKEKNRKLESFRRRMVRFEDGSDTEPRLRSRRREQQSRVLSQELEEKLSEDDNDKDADSRELLQQFPSQNTRTVNAQHVSADKGPVPLLKFPNNPRETTDVQPRPYQGAQNVFSFHPSLRFNDAPGWPAPNGVSINEQPSPRYEAGRIWRQTDRSTQTDDPTNQLAEIRRQADGTTQTEEPMSQPDNHVAQADGTTQTEEPKTQPAETRLQADGATQTDEPYTQPGNVVSHADNCTQTDPSRNQAVAATQTDEQARILVSQHLGLQCWILIMAACLLLLLTLFAFYHGIQAKGERAMWLAANDYSRRAVVYHHSASVRGGGSGCLTTVRMRDLSIGYGGGFGKYGVEM